MSKSKQDLAEAIISQLRPKYDLVYVDYRDKLSDEQVGHLVAGDFEKLYESLEEFESEARYSSIKQEVEELQGHVLRDWEDAGEITAEQREDLDDNFYGSNEWEDVRAEVDNRDESNWLKQLASQSDRALLRINCIDEDNGFSFQQVNPLEVLSKVGLESTEHNEKAVADTLLECSPEFSVLLGYWVVGADVEAFLDLPSEGEVEITNPFLYLGNPFTGSGFISEVPLHGKVRVPRNEVRTDKQAFGYSIDTIFGGVYASSFTAEIAAVPENATT